MKSLKSIRKEWKDCNDCGLGEHARMHVFYRGSVPCDVLFVGEAPGKNEDLLGEPFVGKAGDTLNELIRRTYEELGQVLVKGSFTYGITNILACRPANDEGKDRIPTKVEAKACSPRLRDTILVASPKLIVLLGRTAETHYKMQAGVVSCPVVHLEHPSFINRNGGIGSVKFDSVLLRLVEALEKHLYGSSSQAVSSQPSGEEGDSSPRQGRRTRKKAVRRPSHS